MILSNNLQIFTNEEFGQVRTVIIDNKPYFYGADVATSLEYARPSKAVSDHCKGVLTRDTIKNSGGYAEKLIPEGDIYRLVVKASEQSTNPYIKEKAERFASWIFDEILPEIREKGSYQKPLSEKEMLRIQLGMIDEVEQRVEKLENHMTIDYGQQLVLKERVNSIVIHWLGGKDSNAYHEMSKKVFSECNKDFQKYFNVNSRNNTPKIKFDDAVYYLAHWEPCNNTKLEIQGCNAQINLSA